MVEEGKRYKKVTTITWVEDSKGKYLGKKGPGGSIGLLDLSITTHLGLPQDPATKKPYSDAGFTPDETKTD